MTPTRRRLSSDGESVTSAVLAARSEREQRQHQREEEAEHEATDEVRRDAFHDLTDGAEFGFGAEIGISTQKLHARGPMGMPEMTTTKYVVTGDGHIRT